MPSIALPCLRWSGSDVFCRRDTTLSVVRVRQFPWSRSCAFCVPVYRPYNMKSRSLGTPGGAGQAVSHARGDQLHIPRDKRCSDIRSIIKPVSMIYYHSNIAFKGLRSDFCEAPEREWRQSISPNQSPEKRIWFDFSARRSSARSQPHHPQTHQPSLSSLEATCERTSESLASTPTLNCLVGGSDRLAAAFLSPA